MKKSNSVNRSSFRRKLLVHLLPLFQLLVNLVLVSDTAAVTRTSRASGNWDNPSTWSPAGVPASNDDVTIQEGNTVTLNNNGQAKNLTVAPGAFFTFLAEKTLTLAGGLAVNGTADMNGGNLLLQNYGAAFVIGPDGTFTWSPGNNSPAGATLFTNGTENFSPTSTLIIRKWYDYAVPLGDVVTGNFGNLTIETYDGVSSVIEWNQKNRFSTHVIQGTLTLGQGWVTLDKTGAISATQIGEIVLTSINSTFIAHNGTHPASFNLTVNSVINNGGTFYGLNDGNGNVDIHVLGNFYNNGNVKIINNSGISGVSNGNAVFRVDGDYMQTGGDTRIIYNITTTNSGTFNATMKNLSLTGGIFMGQSACHTAANTNYLTITDNLLVQFNNAADKFRGNGITSIGPVVNNARLYFTVGKNLDIQGNPNAEFTSSAAAGTEKIQVNGDMNISGCKVNFNYGTTAAAHTTEIYVGGSIRTDGGTCCLSANPGALNALIGKGVAIANGSLTVKGNTGAATMNVNGSYTQTGGTFSLHVNHTVPTGDLIRTNINGNFRQTAGVILYDNNAAGAAHIISLRGESVDLEGTGIIYRDGSGTTNVYGILSFDRGGKINYERNGNAHFLEQVVQQVNRGCEVNVVKGNLNLSSHTSNGFYSLRILPGGKLHLSDVSVASNGLYPYCQLQVDSSGVLAFSNEQGFRGSLHAALKNEVGYFLHGHSIVEYNGLKKQHITGNSLTENLPERKYGILRVNLGGPKYTAELGNDVDVRTRLELVQGGVRLNSHILSVQKGTPEAIVKKKGFIVSEQEETAGTLRWENISTGMHEFPFGRSVNSYLPVKINVTGGAGNAIGMNTYSVSTDDFSQTNFTGGSQTENSNEPAHAVRRRWDVKAPGVTADVTLTFDKEENVEGGEYDFFNALTWTGNLWTTLPGTSSGESGFNTRSAIIRNNNVWTNFALVPDTIAQALRVRFTAVEASSDEVVLNWESKADKDFVSFSVERSSDGITYYEIGRIANVPDKGLPEFRFADTNPAGNVSFYRIKLNGIPDGPVYSDTKKVSRLQREQGASPAIQSVNPNPFTDNIEIHYASPGSPVFQIADVQGKVVFRKNGELSGAGQVERIQNLGFLKNGVYFLSLTSNGKTNTIKIIKY
jgi:hypothetical protein